MEQNRFSIGILHCGKDYSQSRGLSNVERYRLRRNVLIGCKGISLMVFELDL
jgi:hypothetical protein